ncbi:MAG TPA: D-alanyl-D-alanine carboxypeptidase [Lachnospiraceae bacterium]|jgi:serine-type D-ala-D-ala carboxypeptidase|nr:D-alanyl-D-alanine carboxypeptidase [Lachnospiraceae bacterium]
MKKIVVWLTVLITVMSVIVPVKAEGPEIEAPCAILTEASTGRVIYEKNADESLHPASITKIMTLLIIFDAVEDGSISPEDTVTVSEHAASMGGSQVFLEPGETQTVETMIKCIAIASANDACVAMAEHISGSEDAFVQSMNERAEALGMNNTHFVNCCGLDADGHMTTARDVAIMSRELITAHPAIHDYSCIWMDTITHVTRRGESEFVLNNTNKLLKQYEWATGLKTGSTSLAKFCLSATARRNDIELISVIMASPSGKTRVSDSIALLNYGYGICSLYHDNNMPSIDVIPIKGGIKSDISVEYSSQMNYLFTNKYDASLIESHAEYLEDLEAPVQKGDVIGQLTYTYDGKFMDSIDIIASESIKKAGYGDYINSLWQCFLGN